jgi:hypothetical protein
MDTLRAAMAAPRSPELSRLRRESLSTTWLAARLGTEPERIEVRRRSGELLGFREPGDQEFYYPVWQFDRDGAPSAWVPRVVEAAREAGIPDERLYEILTMRAGVVGGRRVAELLRDGDEGAALAAIRSAAT